MSDAKYFFSIDDTHYRIFHEAETEVVWFSEVDADGNYIKSLYNLDTYKLEGATPMALDEWMGFYLNKVNEILKQGHGDDVPPPDFSNILEELSFRIENNLEVVDKQVRIIAW